MGSLISSIPQVTFNLQSAGCKHVAPSPANRCPAIAAVFRRHRSLSMFPTLPFCAAKGQRSAAERAAFTSPKGSDRRLKGQLLQAQRAAFRKRKDSDGKTIGQRCFHHCKDIAFLSVMLGDDIIKVSPLFSFVFFNVSRRHCSAKSRRTCCPPCGKCVFLQNIATPMDVHQLPCFEQSDP